MQKQDEKILLAPTDLSNFLSCNHCSRRDLEAVKGKCERPIRYGPVLDALKERGRKHEEAYLKHLRNNGLDIFEPGSDLESPSGNDDKTLSAMQDGFDIIYQPVLTDGSWYGRADFLQKVNRPSALGNWSYEAVDTKLATETLSLIHI